MEISLPEDVFLKTALHVQPFMEGIMQWRLTLGELLSKELTFLEEFVQGTFSGCRNFPSRSSPWRSCSQGMEESLYTMRHNEVAEKARSMVRCVEESLHASQSVEIGFFKKILAELKFLELSFVDVKMLLFKPKYGTVLHLVGLHYCFTFLKFQVVDIVKAVVDDEISNHQVCLQWSILGSLLYDFCMRGESHSRDVVFLLDIVSSQGHGVLRLLSRGAVYEVM